MSEAVGFLEVQGYSVALAAMNEACKVAEIKIKGIESNNPKAGDQAFIPVVMQIKFTGSIENVKLALTIAYEEAKKYIDEKDIFIHHIPLMSEGLNNLLPIGKVKLKSPR